MIVALGSSVFSQAPAISEEKFSEAWRTALAASEKKKRQVTVVSETKNDDNILTIDKHIEEFSPPDGVRFSDIVSPGGKKSYRNEMIEVGDSGYFKQDDGPWLEYTVRIRDRKRTLMPDIFPRTDRLEEPNVECTVTNAVLDGQSTKVFTREEKSASQGIAYGWRESVWISDEGLIVKTEIANTQEHSIKWIKRTVAVWSYDPFGFEIESPVKNK